MAEKNDSKADSQDGEEACTHTLDHFSEHAEVTTIINSTASIYEDQIALEAAHERLIIILDKYQEQPHLLDPYLENLVNTLLNITRETCITAVYHQSFKYLYLITKMRGYKNIVRLFPHEVADVEYVLSCLYKQDPNDHQTWETRYVLLLWLSIVCMVPFDMSRFDGSMKSDDGHRKSVIDRIIDISKVYLQMTDKSRDAAAVVLAKFVSRPDVKQNKLAGFLDWSLITLSQANGDTMKGVSSLMGTLSTLALLFKHGKRDDLVPFAAQVLNQVTSCKVSELNNTLLRKLGIKLVQRLGLTFLKPRIASWRYKRGNRSLVINLAKSEDERKQDSSKMPKLDQSEEEDEEYDVPEEIEDVLDLLLSGLKDKDTIVRWSAAKGIGRITGRLPKDLADEVVGSVLDFFSFRETDGAWHGGCLALAELGRRGLLLPSRLPAVVPVVLKALAYDEKRGSCSVGAHVRDAACYVCWAFARAYEPQELKPFVQSIANALVIATVFDREINCRRAASAAFQENVGRQGTFPHGIDILTTADYFTVGNRTNSYMNISLFIAEFEEYTTPLIDHLVEVKLQHWDCAIRELASKTLHELTPKAPDYIIKKVLPQVVSQTLVADLFTRHGSILAAAELIHAIYLYLKPSGRSVEEVVDPDCIKQLKDIVPKLIEVKQFRGFSGEYMRSAACILIEKMSLIELTLEDSTIEILQGVIDDNLPHVVASFLPIQEQAVKALPALCNQYYLKPDSTAKPVRDAIIDRCVEQLQHSTHLARMGFAQALGSLPRFMLVGKLRKVLTGLIDSTKLQGENDGVFAESRRDSIKALASICVTVGLSTENNVSEEDAVSMTTLRQVYECFLSAMSDYTADSRGDAGAWVREAAMSGLEQLTCEIVKTDPALLPADLCEKMMCCVVQQAAEKIDRTRALAGGSFLRLVHHDSPEIPHIPHHTDLKEIFPRSLCSDLNWSAPSDCFRYMTKLLALSSYQYSVLLGVIVSVGGLTESLVRQSSSALLKYLKEIQTSKEKLEIFGETVLHIYKQNKKNDRVIMPLFKVIDLLLSNGVFDLFLEEEGHTFPATLFSLTSQEISKCGDAKKLLTSINVFCGLIQFAGQTRKKSLSQLLILLCHKYPRVRNTVADMFYTTLLTYDDLIPEEVQEQVMSILSETAWEADVQSARTHRNKICDLLGLPKPRLKTNATARPAAAPTNQDELSSYQALVSSHDY